MFRAEWAWLCVALLAVACAPKTRMVGNVMVPVEPVDWEAECNGGVRCMDLCQQAQSDPGLLAACSEAKDAATGQKRAAARASKTPAERAAQDQQTAPAALGPGARPHPQPLPPAGLFVRSVSAVVVVKTSTGQGSGFGVHGSGVIVTNLHVVQGESQIEVQLWDGRTLLVSQVEAFSVRHDLAALRVKEQVNTLALAPREDLIPGERIVAIGNPLGLQFTISEGIVGGLRAKPDGTHVVQVTTAISPGSSGGPILNEWGAVVAVATFKLIDGESLNFAMPTRYVHQLLRSPKPMDLTAFAAATKRVEPKAEPKADAQSGGTK